MHALLLGMVNIVSGILGYFFSHPQHLVKGIATTPKVYAYITTVPMNVSSATPSSLTISPTEKISLLVLPTHKPLSVTPTSSLANDMSSKDLEPPTSSPTLTPTLTPTNVSSQYLQTSTPSVFPTVLPTPILVPVSSIGLNADKIFSLINSYRNTHNLASFQKNDFTCNVATQRAPQAFNEIFVTGTMDAGLKAMNLPYWVTENIINDDTEQDAVDWWIQDSTHRQIILGNYTYSCVACSGYTCAEIFTNLIAK